MAEEEFVAFLEKDPFFRLEPATATTRRFVHEIFTQLSADSIAAQKANTDDVGTSESTEDADAETETELFISEEQLLDFNKAYMNKCVTALLPGNVGQLQEIGFLPR